LTMTVADFSSSFLLLYFVSTLDFQNIANPGHLTSTFYAFTMLRSTVLITGGNRGLGLEMVKQLASSPTSQVEKVLAVCRKPADAEKLREIAAKGEKVKILRLDVTDYDSLPHFAEDVEVQKCSKYHFQVQF